MPYEIKHDGEGEKAYCVYNKLTDEQVGCSATEEEAQAHMRALYANETKEAVDFVTVLKNFFSTLIEKVGNIGGSKPRSELEDSDFVFASERKFPVVTAADVSDAVSSWGRYKGSRTFAEFKSRLISLCRRKGFIKALPEAWKVKEIQEIEVYKDAVYGVWRWVTVSSTGFLDRDQEIVSSKALAAAVAEAEKNNYDPGYLTYWHERPIRVGKCDGRFVEEFCMVETGYWFNDDVSEALRKDVAFNPDLWAISTEFLGSLYTAAKNVIIQGTKVDVIWNNISFKDQDRSILPAWRASNTFSMIESQGGASDMRDEKVAFLRERVGEELATKVAEEVDATNKLASEAGSVVKEESVVEGGNIQEEQSQESTSTVSTSKAEVSGPLNALRVFAATLDEAKQKELAVIIIALDKVLTDREPAAEPEDETPADSTGYDTTANDETAKEDASKTSEDTPAPSGESKQDTSTEQVAEIAEVASLKQEVAALKDSISTMGNVLVELRDALVRKQQEDMPKAVVQRASVAEDNVLASRKEIEDIKAKANDGTDTISDMAQSIVNILGGMN